MILDLFGPLLSTVWSIINAIARWFYKNRSWRPPCKVISVGNIVAGGTGKTEFVNYIARYYLEKNKKVVIAMRGYGSAIAIPKDGLLVKSAEESIQKNFPDECSVHLIKAPGVAVVVGANRVAALKKYWNEINADFLILDDGLQHFKIQRDLDVVVHDFGVKAPVFRDFPGILENKNILRISMASKADDVRVSQKWKHLDWVKAHYAFNGVQTKKGLFDVAAKNVYAVCGIANPFRFRRFLDGRVQSVVGFTTFADHYNYTLNDLERIQEQAKKLNADVVLTTLKDYVKLQQLNVNEAVPVGYVQINAKIMDRPELLSSALESLL